MRPLLCLLALLAAGPALAQNDPTWTQPIAPFKIAGNLYYVGSKGLASYLVTTQEGHILINANLEESVPQIRASIEKLGFKLADVKVLLISHAHFDHDAGGAALKKLTGASYQVMDADVPNVVTGGLTDFMYGRDRRKVYPPVAVDRVLHDGDEVTLGGTTLVAHLTPGHTKGCTTWTLRIKDGGKTLDAVIVGSPYVNPGYQLFNNFQYLDIARDYEKTFQVLAALPCDLFLGAHGAYFGMDAKLAKLKKGGPNPFVDPEGYKKFVAATEKAFRDEVARQRQLAK